MEIGAQLWLPAQLHGGIPATSLCGQPGPRRRQLAFECIAFRPRHFRRPQPGCEEGLIVPLAKKPPPPLALSFEPDAGLVAALQNAQKFADGTVLVTTDGGSQGTTADAKLGEAHGDVRW